MPQQYTHFSANLNIFGEHKCLQWKTEFIAVCHYNQLVDCCFRMHWRGATAMVMVNTNKVATGDGAKGQWKTELIGNWVIVVFASFGMRQLL